MADQSEADQSGADPSEQDSVDTERYTQAATGPSDNTSTDYDAGTDGDDGADEAARSGTVGTDTASTIGTAQASRDDSSSSTTEEAPAPTVVVGVLADPDYPIVLARRLAKQLPQRLSQRVDDTVNWDVRVGEDPITATTRDSAEILQLSGQHVDANEWDLVIYITDLPLRENWYPIIAEVSLQNQAALVSLPALGGGFAHRNGRHIITRLIGELAHRFTDANLDRNIDRGDTGSHLARFARPVWRGGSDKPTVDHRFVAPVVRGRIRLQIGMVVSNRPWRLIFGLTSALAAAIAMSIFILQSEMIWDASASMGPARLMLGSVGSIAVMVVWIIAAHGLWERTRAVDREHAVLYNVATTITLAAGVLMMHIGVFAFVGIASQYLIIPDVLEATLGRAPGFADYLNGIWVTTAAATVAGALGSGLESEETIRQTAYGYRERQRQRSRQRRMSDSET